MAVHKGSGLDHAGGGDLEGALDLVLADAAACRCNACRESELGYEGRKRLDPPLLAHGSRVLKRAPGG